MKKAVNFLCLLLLLGTLFGCGAKQGSLPSSGSTDEPSVGDTTKKPDVPEEPDVSEETPATIPSTPDVQEEEPGMENTETPTGSEDASDGENLDTDSTPDESTEVLVNTRVEDDYPEPTYRDSTEDVRLHDSLYTYFFKTFTLMDNLGDTQGTASAELAAVQITAPVRKYVTGTNAAFDSVESVVVHPVNAEAGDYFVELQCNYKTGTQVDSYAFAAMVRVEDSKVKSSTIYATEDIADVKLNEFEGTDSEPDVGDESSGYGGDSSDIFGPGGTPVGENPGSTIPQGPGGWEMLDPSDPDFVQLD